MCRQQTPRVLPVDYNCHCTHILWNQGTFFSVWHHIPSCCWGENALGQVKRAVLAKVLIRLFCLATGVWDSSGQIKGWTRLRSPLWVLGLWEPLMALRSGRTQPWMGASAWVRNDSLRPKLGFPDSWVSSHLRGRAWGRVGGVSKLLDIQTALEVAGSWNGRGPHAEDNEPGPGYLSGSESRRADCRCLQWET